MTALKAHIRISQLLAIMRSVMVCLYMLQWLQVEVEHVIR